MSMTQRSFWRSIPGFATGTVGFLAATIGVITGAAQLGWIGGDSDGGRPARNDPATTAEGTTEDGGEATPSSGNGRASTSRPSFRVEPTSVTFERLPLFSPRDDERIEVHNTGTAAFTVEDPTIDGPADDQFEVEYENCTTGRVEPRGSCELRVSFSPDKAGTHEATLRITVKGASRPGEVALEGTALL